MSLLCKCRARWLGLCASWHSAPSDTGTVHKHFFQGEGETISSTRTERFTEPGTNLQIQPNGALEFQCRSWQRASVVKEGKCVFALLHRAATLWFSDRIHFVWLLQNWCSSSREMIKSGKGERRPLLLGFEHIKNRLLVSIQVPPKTSKEVKQRIL